MALRDLAVLVRRARRARHDRLGVRGSARGRRRARPRCLQRRSRSFSSALPTIVSTSASSRRLPRPRDRDRRGGSSHDSVTATRSCAPILRSGDFHVSTCVSTTPALRRVARPGELCRLAARLLRLCGSVPLLAPARQRLGVVYPQRLRRRSGSRDLHSAAPAFSAEALLPSSVTMMFEASDPGDHAARRSGTLRRRGAAWRFTWSGGPEPEIEEAEAPSGSGGLGRKPRRGRR